MLEQVNREKTGVANKLQSLIMGTDFVKNKIFDTARKQVIRASGGLYPAPLKVSENVRFISMQLQHFPLLRFSM